MIEFKSWGKTPRLFRDIIITEKIDGTNAAIIIEEGRRGDSQDGWCAGVFLGGAFIKVGAQSRKRIITPDADNFGFARWVQNNGEELARLLGPGYHFGEWWGSGIQRGYGLPKGEKRFSLFNVNRYADLDADVPGLGLVPVLYEGPFSEQAIQQQLQVLEDDGSIAAPGFLRAEGIVVYHTASNSVFKVTIEDDGFPKGLSA